MRRPRTRDSPRIAAKAAVAEQTQRVRPWRPRAGPVAVPSGAIRSAIVFAPRGAVKELVIQDDPQTVRESFEQWGILSDPGLWGSGRTGACGQARANPVRPLLSHFTLHTGSNGRFHAPKQHPKAEKRQCIWPKSALIKHMAWSDPVRLGWVDHPAYRGQGTRGAGHPSRCAN